MFKGGVLYVQGCAVQRGRVRGGGRMFGLAGRRPKGMQSCRRPCLGLLYHLNSLLGGMDRCVSNLLGPNS